MRKRKSGHDMQSTEGPTTEKEGSSKKNKTAMNGDLNNPKQKKSPSIMDSDSQVKVNKMRDDNSGTLQIAEESNLENSPKKKKKQKTQIKKKKQKTNAEHSIDSSDLQIVDNLSLNVESSSKKKKKKQKTKIIDNTEPSAEISDPQIEDKSSLNLESSPNKKKKKQKPKSTGLKPSSTSLITNGEKLSKKKKKRLAVQLHKTRVNEIKEKLSNGIEVGYIVRQLQSIVEEKKKVSDLKISISCAKKLIYFHKHGKEPTSKKTRKFNKGDDETENNDRASDSDDADNVEVNIKGKNKEVQKKKLNIVEKLKNVEAGQKGQSRYVLFVGNIPYNATANELKDFFSKTGDVRDVRLPLEKGSNNPRGFAYVEFSDEASYQRGLSLHHTMMRDRRINVLYTQGGKKKGEGEIIRKNLKLHAMRKKGILTGTLKDSKKTAKGGPRKKLQPNN